MDTKAKSGPGRISKRTIGLRGPLERRCSNAGASPTDQGARFCRQAALLSVAFASSEGLGAGIEATAMRRSFLRALAMLVMLASAQASGQRLRLPRVALVFGSAPVADMAGDNPVSPFARAFLHALRDLGLVEGRNITIERRSAEGRLQRLDALMREMVSLGVDVIVTFGSPGVTAAQRATDRIPIVCVVTNVLDLGVIDSLSRPGRNVTGIGDPGLQQKELQLLKEAAPTISRVAVLGYRQPAGPRQPRWRTDLEASARAMRVELVWMAVDAAEDLDPAFDRTARERCDALYAMGTFVNFANQRRIAEFALNEHLPSVGFAESGMLLSYGADLGEALARAAVYVKKILDGARPADLPFEQPTRYSLVVNLKTANALAVVVPTSLLVRADTIIR